MSLRSRIRGGQVYLSDKGATAAQFLTLRLTPIGSTHMGRDDSDGPGHAPRYLDVRPNMIQLDEARLKVNNYLDKMDKEINSFGSGWGNQSDAVESIVTNVVEFEMGWAFS